MVASASILLDTKPGKRKLRCSTSRYWRNFLFADQSNIEIFLSPTWTRLQPYSIERVSQMSTKSSRVRNPPHG
jgi:hypothetical protein